MAFDPRLKILVVDDSEAMRKILAGVLGKMGFLVVREAEGGQIAWKMLQEAQEKGAPFKFVLCSSSMQVMTGLELLKTIRVDQQFKRLPFLMILSEDEQGDAAEAVKAGVTNFVIRPFSRDVLEEKMLKIFES